MLLFENAYISLFFYFIISSILATILFILPLLLSTSNSSQEHEKVSAYECGFEPFSDVRDTFDIHFIVVAILFIIFDLELIFIFP
jgi:NADH:ubiquinone oxidoreductase subunit 3 (subunit A)